MLGNIAEPHLIELLGCEVPLHQIIMHGWSDLAAVTEFLGEHRPHLVFAAQEMHPVRADAMSGRAQFVV